MKRCVLPLLALSVLLALPLAAEEAAMPAVAPAAEPAPELSLDALADPAEPLLMTGCTADTTCSSGVDISCEASGTNQCSTVSGQSVTCGSCSITCSSVDARAQCLEDCDAAYFSCLANSGCPQPITRTCAQPCIEARFQCRLNCPSAPTHCVG